MLYNDDENNIDNANEYTVYGGNTYFSGGLSEMQNKDYALIGTAKGVHVFSARYKYYVIANLNQQMIIEIDAAQGSNNSYYGTNTTSNTVDHVNLEGEPDNKYVSISNAGYILINASNDNLNSLKVFGKN